MTDLVRVRWACPNCETMHDLTEPRLVAIDTANNLMASGILMVVLYDEAYAIMLDRDKAEAASLTEPANQLTPKADARKGFKAWLIGHANIAGQ